MLKYAATRKELPGVMKRVIENGEKIILDYARENQPLREANNILDESVKLVKMLDPGDMFAVKYTGFGSRDSPIIANSYIDTLVSVAKLRDVRICLDAEDVLYPNLAYNMMAEHNTKDKVHVYKTYQMYRRDAMRELLDDIASSSKDKIMLGVKLVRGAYLKKQGHVFNIKGETDAEYNKAIRTILVCKNVHVILATHNENSLIIATNFKKERYVTAQLLGMGREGHIDYRYIPTGTVWELVPYLFRRFVERMSWNG